LNIRTVLVGRKAGKVPDVLLSGDHEKVREWRLARSRERAAAFAEEERKAANDAE